MAVTVRFRPILFGRPRRPTGVSYLAEGQDGGTILRDFEASWSLNVPLDSVTVKDLPEPYRSRVVVTLLPVQEVSGESPAEVSRRIDELLSQAPARRRRSA